MCNSFGIAKPDGPLKRRRRRSKMLVLSRKKHEGVVFNGPGRVVVIEICGDKVRLGFQCDPAVTVHRDEVAAKIARENGDA
jgi:carbon storage regulator CsrA